MFRTGSIPECFGEITQLQYLYVRFCAPCPDSIESDLRVARLLSRRVLSINNLTGTIPAALCELTQLHELYALLLKLSIPEADTELHFRSLSISM